MLNEKDTQLLVERLYALETTNKGFTTRIRLLEADVDKLKELERKRL